MSLLRALVLLGQHRVEPGLQVGPSWPRRVLLVGECDGSFEFVAVIVQLKR
jgi:hypothetical protein